jgi:SAM-dependent methyltransferase
MVKSFNWAGDCYGMEISEFAKTQAKNHGVKFSKDIFNSENFFDLIVFRGTIQHIDEPFLYMKQCHSSLKKGGKVAFLATPNTNSIYFKIWSTLPFLDYPKTNYYIPNDKWIENAMKNYGFRLIDKRYPYIRSPYSNPVKDHIMFVTKLLGFNVKFPFWRNSMDLIFEKELL